MGENETEEEVREKESEESRVYTLTFPGEAVLLLEESIREYGGWLQDQEYPDGLESHNHEATFKKERCFKLQMAIREQCPYVFKVQPSEPDSEGQEPVNKEGE